jgi:hypothetical protein
MEAMLERGGRSDEFCALNDAVCNGHWPAVEKMLQKCPDRVDGYAYSMSCMANDIKLTQTIRHQLAKKTTIFQMDAYDRNTFCTACEHGHIHLALNLLKDAKHKSDWIIRGIGTALKHGHHKFAYYMCTAFATTNDLNNIMDTVANSTSSYWSNAIKLWIGNTSMFIALKRIPPAVNLHDMNEFTYEECFDMIKMQCQRAWVEGTYMFRLAAAILKRRADLMYDLTILSQDIINIIAQY